MLVLCREDWVADTLGGRAKKNLPNPRVYCNPRPLCVDRVFQPSSLLTASPQPSSLQTSKL